MKTIRQLKHNRLTDTRDALLMFANAHNGTCMYFEPPIDNDDAAMRAIQISNELWEDDSLIPHFLESETPFLHRNADYKLMSQWVDALHGPVLCMETHGDKALFLCEGSVFEVVSYDRTWDSMVPYTPDMIITTLLPTDDEISFDGLVLRHDCRAEGPGLQRTQNEFAEGCKRGVIRNSKQFSKESRRIKQLWKTKGLDPTSYTVYMQAIEQLNELLEYTCFPYEPDLLVREWDED